MPSVRKLYVRLVPESIRSWVRRHPLLAPLRSRYCANTARHDEFYDSTYYDQVDGRQATAIASAPLIAEDIVGRLNASTVIDVGCGTGEYLCEFRIRGAVVYGVELADVAIQRCREQKLEVEKHDLTSDLSLPWRADTVFSSEVAEHLVPDAADNFVDKLSGAAIRDIVLTAAGPGQPGLNHFNCQPKSYWIQKFEARGFSFDAALTEELEKRYREQGAAPWFQKNLMVFHRSS